MTTDNSTEKPTELKETDNTNTGVLVDDMPVHGEQSLAPAPDNALPPMLQQSSRVQAIDHMIELAITSDAGIEKLDKLLSMKERYDEMEDKKRREAKAETAKDAYTSAMVDFKAEDLVIYKDKLVDFESRDKQSRTTYMHASIGNVCRVIIQGLAKHGFSHKWIPEQQEGGNIKLTCVITHKLGHCESISLTAGPDQTGNKNNIQAINSTKTYLERYTLLDITGVATMDQEDDDGAASSQVTNYERITKDQGLQIDAKITDNSLNEKLFTGWFNKKFPYAATVDELGAEHFDVVINKLDATIKLKNEKDD